MNKRTIQAELWNRLTEDFKHMSHEDYETPRILELERLYHYMCDKFGKTLTDSQQEAFYGLMGISDSIKYSQRDIGVAFGMEIAKEMHKLLSCPIGALQQASESWTPVPEAEESSIRSLNKYFDEMYRKGRCFQ